MRQFSPSKYSHANPDDYGFLFSVPILLGYAASKFVPDLFDDKEEEVTPASIAKKYWWVLVMGVPLGFVVVNTALNKMASPEEKAAQARKAAVKARQAAEKARLVEDWG